MTPPSAHSPSSHRLLQPWAVTAVPRAELAGHSRAPPCAASGRCGPRGVLVGLGAREDPQQLVTLSAKRFEFSAGIARTDSDSGSLPSPTAGLNGRQGALQRRGRSVQASALWDAPGVPPPPPLPSARFTAQRLTVLFCV